MANDASTQFYQALQDKATDTVGKIVNTTLVPIEYPAQGDFAWDWLNPNIGGPSGAVNQKTFDYISARVVPGTTPGTVALQGSASFPNAFQQILGSIMFSFSAADQTTVTNAKNNAALQAAALVTDYQTAYGPIADVDVTKAGFASRSDYIVGYVIAQEWSGATPPLSYEQLTSARNLSTLLPKRPMGSDQILTDLGLYLGLMAPANTLLTMQSNAAWVLRQMMANVTAPSTTNGGMSVFDPVSGGVSPTPAVPWSVNQSVQQINNDLANTSRTISVGMRTTQGAGSSLSVSVEGDAALSVGSLLSFDVGGGASYDMSKASGTSTECSVQITYKGYSFVPFAPTAFDQSSSVGWYSSDPVAQAAANQGKDVTGYRFVTAPPFDLSPVAAGGDFGLLTGLLVANYPDVTITYEHADYAAFQQAWQEHVSGSLTLFGFIKLGGFSENAYSSEFSAGSDNSTFTVTFSASPQVTTVPQYQRTAYVIAGVVGNPGVTS